VGFASLAAVLPRRVTDSFGCTPILSASPSLFLSGSLSQEVGRCHLKGLRQSNDFEIEYGPLLVLNFTQRRSIKVQPSHC
jgi:hypothetical protein